MKKLSPKTIAALVGAAVVVLIGAFVLFRPAEENPETFDPEAQQSSQSAQLSDDSEDERPTNPAGIPDLNSSDRNYEKPYPAVDFENLSLSTLTKEDIESEIQEFLPKLLELDPDVIKKQVSPRTTGGEYNPFRLMMDVCLADKTTGDAFRNMGKHTTYEILTIESDPSRTNFVDITLSISTPYMASRATEFAAGPISEDFGQFKSSGAAKAISRLDMGKVPMNTDLVKLTFLIEDDILKLYFPTSYTYGKEIPQYAFFWGAIEFQGTKDGDLLLNNTFAECKEISESKVDSKIIDYLRTAMEATKRGDMEKIMAMEIDGHSMQGSLFNGIYSSYKRAFKRHENLEKDVMDRLATLECDYRFFLQTDPELEETSYCVAVTYSTIEPLTGGRAYDTEYFTFSSRRGLKDCPEITNNTLSSIIETSMGGSPTKIDQRIYLEEYLNKNR